MSNPLVSISCITYNHAPFIRDCLDGFLMQKCDFEFEILIHDDASTDGTRDIIKEYQEKYPEIIKPMFQSENQYSKGVRGIMARFNFPRAKGKYIALCEGDDYWISKEKLQKQVSFLEANVEYSLVFSGRIVVDKNGEFLREEIPNKLRYTISDNFSGFVPSTQTILFRNHEFFQLYFNSNQNIYSGDRAIGYLAAMVGQSYCLPEVTAAYRETGEGIWSSYNFYEKSVVHESQLHTFHVRLGWDVSNPEYVFRLFDKLASHILRCFLHPRNFFNKEYYSFILQVWRRFRYMKRFMLLRKALYKKVKKAIKF